MDHAQKIEWMAVWAAKHRVMLALEGECGFGRECVGISVDGHFPDYEWYDDDYNELSGNTVWTPPDAYHKHPCVAVLGRGEPAEAQLYDWLKWFDANGFTVETGAQEVDPKLGVMAIMLGKHRYARMVRKQVAVSA